jgi:mitogen-activated protein kinase 1/3
MEDYYGIKSRRAREYIRSLPFKKKIPFRALFPKSNDLALDLLEKLLAFNPAKRISVEDALRHPYLEPYHDPDDEPTAPPIPDGFFDFDKNKDALSKEQLKGESGCFFRCSICTNLFSLDLRGNHAVNSDIRIDLSRMSGSILFYSACTLT